MARTTDLDELRDLPAGLVLYVGQALERAAGLPTRGELARRLLDSLPEGVSPQRRRELGELIDEGELADAFTELERDLTRARLGFEVERMLDDRSVEVPVLGQLIASLGARVHGVLTPNLDRLIERAFGSRLVTHVRPNMSMAQKSGWLLKFNGTLHDHSSWVLTREQHARVSWREPVHARVLESLLLVRHILFIGTGLEDPIFAAVVDQIRGLSEGMPPRHWALVSRAQLGSPLRAKLDEAGISPIVYDDDGELFEILRSLAPDPRVVPELPPRPRRPPRSGPLRILFASASPSEMDELAVDREQRVVRSALERAKQRERIEFETRVAISFADLSRALLEAEYDLVHVASHGDPMGIVLDAGGRRAVPPAKLMELFDEHAPPRGRLRCVVLNSCWSSEAARLPSQVTTRVAMNGPVDDGAALAFSEGFYDVVGAGHDFARAFREGQRRAAVAEPGRPFDVQLFESP